MRRPVTILLCLGALVGALVAPAPAVAATTTVVSLTFDDGYDNHVTAGSVLDQHGVKGTFFINSGALNTTRHLTWDQVDQLAAAGHEIGGHAVHHVDLTNVDSTTAKREVCDDRTSLLNRGYAVTNFAYPYGYGYNDPTIRSIVQQCGYNSARMAWGIGPGMYAETIPPSDVWAIKSPSSAGTTTLSQLQTFVTDAETHGGGWVPFYFHDVCDGCTNQAVSPSTLSAFLDWLAPRAATGTTVKTIAQVIGGPVQPPPGTVDSTPPVTIISCNAAQCADTPYTAPVTVGLTSTDTGSGVNTIRYTTDGTTPTLSSPAYQSPITVTTTTTVSYAAWDNAGNAENPKTQLIQIGSTPVDTTPPVSTMSCNGSSCGSGWFASPVQVTLTAMDDLSGVAVIRYTTNGSVPTANSTAYTTPFTISATSVVTYRAWDYAGNVEAARSQQVKLDTTGPSVAITSPTDGATVQGTVKVQAIAADGQSGVASVTLYVDGTTVAVTTRSPYQFSWNTKKVSTGPHTLTAQAANTAGTTTMSSAINVLVRR